jgi:hypothetical protein
MHRLPRVLTIPLILAFFCMEADIKTEGHMASLFFWMERDGGKVGEFLRVNRSGILESGSMQGNVQ